MAKKDKRPMTAENEAEPDDDTTDTPQTDVGPDLEDTDFEFDSSLIPKGVEFEDLAPDFVRPEGFLMVPRINKKTGEISPFNTTFVGILNDIVPWKDNRGKERIWYACTATAATGAMYTSQDEKGKSLPPKPVQKGDRIGISGSGAINALKTKKGHLIYLHWTGNKVPVKNGDMWEIKAKVSKQPLPPPFDR